MNLDIPHHWKAVIVCIVIGWMVLKGVISFRNGFFSTIIQILGGMLVVLFLLGIAQDVYKGVVDKAQHVLTWDWVHQEGNKLLAKKIIPPPARAEGATLEQANANFDACLRNVVSNYQLSADTSKACVGKSGPEWRTCMQNQICSRQDATTVVIPGRTPCMDAYACQSKMVPDSFGPTSAASKNVVQTYLCDWDMLPDSMCTK